MSRQFSGSTKRFGCLAWLNVTFNQITDRARSLGRGQATPSLFLTNPSKIVRLRGDLYRISLSHQYLAAPLRMTCSEGVRLFGLSKAPTPTGACAVFDILFVGTDVLGGPRAIRESPLRVCAVFDALSVGVGALDNPCKTQGYLYKRR